MSDVAAQLNRPVKRSKTSSAFDTSPIYDVSLTIIDVAEMKDESRRPYQWRGYRSGHINATQSFFDNRASWWRTTAIRSGRRPVGVNMRIAMFGSERSQIFALRSTLLKAGHTAHRYKTAPEFLQAVNNMSFDALVIGDGLRDVPALDVLTRIRQDLKLTVPVIVVTTHDSEEYIVKALRQGGDECIVTPVGDREFLARVDAIIRRWRFNLSPVRSIKVGALLVNIDSRRVFREGQPVVLTSKDFDLAVLMLRNVGRLVSRAHIMASVWGWKSDVKSRTLDTHMSRVRTRLGLTEENGWRLTAVYRRGYRLDRLKQHSYSSSSD